MIRNYFKTAWRNFWKNKTFSFINIAGLAIGISAALVIYLIVQFEFSYDTFWKDKSRVYRVVTDMTFPGGSVFKNSGVEIPLPVAARNEMTGIETLTHFITANDPKVTVPVAGSKSPAVFKHQKGIMYADEFYFSMFQYNWLAGSPQAALKDPSQVVLTEDRAKSYFGNIPFENMIGRQINYEDSIQTIVTGIVKQLPDKATDFRFDEFISISTIFNTNLKNQYVVDEWNSVNSNSQLFIKLSPGTKPGEVQAQFAALRNKYRSKENNEKDDTKHLLQPLSDIHFNADYGDLSHRRAHKPTLYGLMAVAVFLLLLGCINFINLTTAQSSQRAKEIGIRKTLGSSKATLALQFLSEIFLLTLIATIVSIAVTPWLLKIFSDFIPPEINFSSVNQPHVWIFLALLVVVMTLISGFYPSWILTKFQPVTVLKNQLHPGASQGRKAWLRKSLTVAQFVIAQFLVIATLVVSKQISYSLNKDLGYKKDAIVYFYTPHNFYSNKKDDRRFALLEKIKSIPAVKEISLGGEAPAHSGAVSSTFKINTGKNEIELMVETINADPAYFDIYGLKLLSGKFPDKSDTAKEYIINETYAKALGFSNPADAIGKFVNRGSFSLPIVGVLKDFHTKSTHSKIGPLIYSSSDRNSYMMHIALASQENSPGLWKKTLGLIEKEYKKLYPDDEFQYNFFDETIAAFYKKEQDVKSLLNWSAGLCIFISCLGLLGLVIYTTNTRVKEIGIRKVLGASVTQIVTLLSKDLISLVMVAFLIAAPLSWLAMNKWLQDFAYRTNISWWVFAACGISMLVLAFFILGIRTVKAAMANPVKSLRTE